MRATLLCTAMLVLAAPLDAQDLPRWELASHPTLRIGVALGDDSPEQFFGLNSAMRLQDGSIILVNSGSRELRKFSATGEFIAAAGRQGSGPREFEWPVRIYRQRGGELAIYDRGLERLSYYDSDLTYLRSAAAAAPHGRTFARDNWLVGRYWVDALGTLYTRTVIESALRKLDAPHDPLGFRRVLVSRDGMLWVRDVAADGTPESHWRVHDNNGSLLGVIELPARFDVLEIGDHYVLGRSLDADDVEYLEMYALTKSGTPVRSSRERGGAARADVSDNERRAIRAFLRNLTTVQELHYARHGTYTTSLDALDAEQPPELHVLIAAADARGWLALAIPKDRDVICTMTVGAAVPVGWTPGVVTCADPL